jgi:uncharacterized protein YegL
MITLIPQLRSLYDSLTTLLNRMAIDDQRSDRVLRSMLNVGELIANSAQGTEADVESMRGLTERVAELRPSNAQKFDRLFEKLESFLGGI